MRMLSTTGPALAACMLLASCGGGDDGGCEQVSAGPTNLTIRNALPTGLRAYLPQLAFGADMAAGECNVVGFDGRGAISLRVEVQQCRNRADDTDCTGRLLGAVRVLTVPMAQGESKSVTVDAATFAAAPGAPR